MGDNKVISEANLFSGAFPQETGLSPAQFNIYLTDFPYLETIEVVGCKGPITKAEFWEALKLVGRDKTPETDGLPLGAVLEAVTCVWSSNRTLTIG